VCYALKAPLCILELELAIGHLILIKKKRAPRGTWLCNGALQLQSPPIASVIWPKYTRTRPVSGQAKGRRHEGIITRAWSK